MSFHIHFYGCIDGDDSDIQSRVTSHYVIDQSMISISEMKKIRGGECKQNPLDCIWTPMYINLCDIFQDKLNI